MKRIIIAAVTAAFILASCSDKNNELQLPAEVTDVGDVTIPVTEASDPGELDASDFRNVTVDVSIHPVEPPLDIEMTERELVTLPDEDGDVMNLSEYIADSSWTKAGHEPIVEEFAVQMIHSCGRDRWYRSGDRAYFSLLRSSADGTYCAIYEYNISNGSYRELRRCTGKFFPARIVHDMRVFGGELFYTAEEPGGDDLDTALKRIDLTTLEIKASYPEYSNAEFVDIDGRLIIRVKEYTDDGMNYLFKEFDPVTEEWRDIQKLPYGSGALMTEQGIFYKEGNPDSTMNIVGEEFRINNAVRGSICAAGEHTVSIMSNRGDISQHIIYTYDLENMERYELDLVPLGSIGGLYPFGDEFLITATGGRKVYYVEPRYGACYELMTAINGSISVTVSGDTAYISGVVLDESGAEPTCRERFYTIRRRQQ